ncbi:hypothetical protein FC701_14520 [Bacillus mycoides]|uniref:Uncharacterized protein n=1 Tax=Bacillus mycoides TaxID=1405 RepID=A0A4U3A885_BACMY|nr:hypothetical protein FC701_14520 [Bacillus mycoides]
MIYSDFHTYKPRLRTYKLFSHSLHPSGFTPHGTKKGSDRFYPSPDLLFHLKRGFLSFSALC